MGSLSSFTGFGIFIACDLFGTPAAVFSNTNLKKIKISFTTPAVSNLR